MAAPLGRDSRDIELVHVLGERNSGTNWLETMFRANFQPPVWDSFCNMKHWAQTPCQPKQRYITVILTRNPYDWAASFFTKPYNSPSHQNLTFTEFLRKPWALNPNNRPKNHVYNAHFKDDSGHGKGRLHLVAHDQGKNAPAKNIYPSVDCVTPVHRIPYARWLPKEWCGHIPVYEAKDSGVAFEGIFQMRGWKLRNFHRVKSWAAPGTVEMVQYDELMKTNHAPAEWLRFISRQHSALRKRLRKELAGKVLVDGYYLVQDTYKDEKKSFDAAAHSRAQMYQQRCVKKPWSINDFKFANGVIDWEAEALFGFTRIPDDAALCGTIVTHGHYEAIQDAQKNATKVLHAHAPNAHAVKGPRQNNGY
jgi:hypothetical protein